MKRNYILEVDVDMILKFGITIPQWISLMGFFKPDFIDAVNPDHFDKLEEEGLIVFEDEFRVKSKLTDKAIELLQKTTKNKVKLIKKEPVISDDFVTTYRSLFKGLKSGSMGYAKAVKIKLNRFMLENEVTEEEILKATRAYLNSLENYRYLQQADYFIFKKDAAGAESSKLAAFIDELRTNGGNDMSDDWTSKLS